MNSYEISVGSATYKIQQEFSEKKSLTELLIEQLLRKKLPAAKFDNKSTN